MHLAGGRTERNRASNVLVAALLGLLLMFGAESFATGWDELPPVEVVQAHLTAGHSAATATAAHIPNTAPAPVGLSVALVLLLVLVLAARSLRRALAATPLRHADTGAPPARRGPPLAI